MSAASNAERVETPDLFAPRCGGSGVVDWQAGPAARAAMGMSDWAMQAIRDESFAAAAIAKLIKLSHGDSRAQPDRDGTGPGRKPRNTIGLLHGATAAALLDTAMGCAISTMPSWARPQ